MDETTLEQFDLSKRKMRDGTHYCSKDADQFIIPLLQKYRTMYPSLPLYLRRATKDNMVDYMVTYGKFEYQAGSWSHPHHVVFKIEKPANQMVFMYTFVVTTMESEPYQVIRFYCWRGKMENFIKEGKGGFDFSAVISKTKLVNANRLQFLKITARVVHFARYTTFKLCSSCLYRSEFYETLQNIRQLQPQLE